MADDSLEVIKGEKKRLKFTVVDSDGVAVDCTDTTCTLDAFDSSQQVVDKEEVDFDKTDAATGILYVIVTFATSGRFTMVLGITFTTGNQLIDKSEFALIVKDLDPPA